jgi:phage terminase small subunit
VARKLTKKQKAFADNLIKGNGNKTQAVVDAGYEVKDRLVARNIAVENMANHGIQTYLAKHSDTVENSIISTINRYKDSSELDEVREAMTNARWVHDKVHGKAVQKTEVSTKSVSILIDLSGQE